MNNGRRTLWRSVLGGLCLAGLLVAVTASSASGTAATDVGAIPGQYIVVLKPTADRAAAISQARSIGGAVFMEYSHALNGFALRLPQNALPGIERNPNVLFVAPDREVEGAAAPAPCADLTQCQRISFGVDRIDGDLSSTRSGDGKGAVPINVAVIDSGIATHPDLNVVGGVNCNGKGESYADQVGHGTIVAGIMGARDNGFGRVGVAPGARLWAVRVLGDQNVGTTSTFICGVDWITATRTDADTQNDIAVANLSAGGQGTPDDENCGLTVHDPLHMAICAATTKGISIVVSAGNEGRDIERFTPASYPEVLTATAMADTDGKPGGAGPLFPLSCRLSDPPTQPDDVFAAFSNFATISADQVHTIAAPGVCIGSTYLDGGYAVGSGTSFASPLVAGTIALCIFSGPCAGLTPAQIIQKMVADATAYNTTSKNSGYGFQGDPLRPVSGKYYGFLIHAGSY